MVDSSEKGYRTVIPGPQYNRSGLHQLFRGKHYRKEWTTPVKLPAIQLETAPGGLKPAPDTDNNHGTLLLKGPGGKQYILRAINKTYSGGLPEIYSNTFVERLANDQASSVHPFASLTVAGMAEAADIYHTHPRVVFVLPSTALGNYNATFGNNICVLEEIAVGNESKAASFENPDQMINTSDLLEKIKNENAHHIDQRAYVRARLFDMFLGDWERHEDQWTWAGFDSAGYTIYRPIPRDRDQTYTKFDGLFSGIATSLADLDHVESFDFKIRNIKTYNFSARNLDRRCANEVSKDVWVSEARYLQQVLTNQVIETNVKKMPPEMFAVSGEKIIAKLKARRDNLEQSAIDYYNFLAKEVDIPGSKDEELFLIEKLSEREVRIQVFGIDAKGNFSQKPFYSRLFNADETKEIRVYGIRGKDHYRVEGNESRINIRIIGGTDSDSVTNASASYKRLRYYDNHDNHVKGNIKARFSNDTLINRYQYDTFRYDERGMVIRPSYSNRRGVYFIVGYKMTHHSWRKEPFAWKQMLKGYYSFSNKSFGADYEAEFIELIGKWNLLINGNYDQVLDNNFPGVGNETKFDQKRSFYKIFTNEANLTVDLNRKFGRFHTIGIRGAYDMVKVDDDGTGLALLNGTSHSPEFYDRKHFAGSDIYYDYHQINDAAVPTKGFRFVVTAAHRKNLNEAKSFSRYSGLLGFYLPITRSISLASRTGAETVTGQPEFYQLSTLGGGRTLRGYFRQRFYGKTSFYNNNDLRYLFDVRTRLFNGKMGLIGFFDQGRLWHPGEDSNQWHWGYGGGVMIAPFNKLSISAYYGVSKELGKFHFRIGRFF